MPFVRRLLRNLVVLSFATLILCKSSLPPADQVERVRAFTRNIEFDYIQWTLDALLSKIFQASLDLPRYLPDERQKQVVHAYLDLVDDIERVNSEIQNIYANPEISSPQEQAHPLLEQLDALRRRRSWLGPLSEAILQQQMGAVLADMRLSLGGQPLPPVLYRITPLPMELLISPRETIRLDVDISLISDLDMTNITMLEKGVEQKLNVSALVEEIGGIGIYPTMVMNTSDLPWLLETIAHEWTHNYLTLRPLGISYFSSPELRTMNETAANIAGKEISQVMLKHFYPEYLPELKEPESDQNTASVPAHPAPLPPFNFRSQMHTTRLRVDHLLEEGKVEEAEAYMEVRRQFFWENGYQIRRLNQAYFAFHGSYADLPGGASGAKDPVGPAVRTLRQQSASLADFLNRISWMTSFEALREEIN